MIFKRKVLVEKTKILNIYKEAGTNDIIHVYNSGTFNNITKMQELWEGNKGQADLLEYAKRHR